MLISNAPLHHLLNLQVQLPGLQNMVYTNTHKTVWIYCFVGVCVLGLIAEEFRELLCNLLPPVVTRSTCMQSTTVTINVEGAYVFCLHVSR